MFAKPYAVLACYDADFNDDGVHIDNPCVSVGPFETPREVLTAELGRAVTSTNSVIIYQAAYLDVSGRWVRVNRADVPDVCMDERETLESREAHCAERVSRVAERAAAEQASGPELF